MRERLTGTLDVEISHMHALGAPPGITSRRGRRQRRRSPNTLKRGTPRAKRRAQWTTSKGKVAVRIGRVLGAECPG